MVDRLVNNNVDKYKGTVPCKDVHTSLFKNRRLSLVCNTVLLWLSECVESLGVMASSGCAYDVIFPPGDTACRSPIVVWLYACGMFVDFLFLACERFCLVTLCL